MKCNSCPLSTPAAEFGNALVSPDTLNKQLAEQKMVGSMMVMEAESLEKCLEILKSDIYYTSGVVRFVFWCGVRI